MRRVAHYVFAWVMLPLALVLFAVSVLGTVSQWALCWIDVTRKRILG